MAVEMTEEDVRIIVRSSLQAIIFRTLEFDEAKAITRELIEDVMLDEITKLMEIRR
jgi:hypothetical protein